LQQSSAARRTSSASPHAVPRQGTCGTARMPKRFVYGLRSACDQNRFYIGVTSDVAARIASHNAGRCAHTAKHRPWELVVAIEFAHEHRALQFERYLKSGSGRAFAKRHFGC
jgi:putative endonuclease